MRRKLFSLVTLVWVLGLVGNASADIVFDAASSGTDGSGGTTLSWSHTIGSGSNRLLIVLPLAEDTTQSDTDIVSVTYNGVAMTEVSGTNVWESPIRANMYYMLESSLPSAGSYTVEITYQGDVSDLAGGAISLRNVKQQAPEAVATNSDPDNNVISTNITTLTNNAWVVDLVGGDRSESFVTTTSGMVERFDNGGSGTHTAAGSTKPVASAGSTTMSWEFDAGSSVLVHTLAAFEGTDATPPAKATNPSPSHQQTDVGIDDNLSWTAGSGATSHDVYFGTDSTPDETEFRGNQAETTYEPNTMDYDTTYYWRIDEESEGGTTTGDVWYFTTESAPVPSDIDWTDNDPGDHLWSTAGNWQDSTKPTINNKASIEEDLIGPIIQAGMNEVVGAVKIGRGYAGSAAELTVTGGTLDVGGGAHSDDGKFVIAQAGSSVAVVTISGGTVTTLQKVDVGEVGTGTLNITGSGAKLDVGSWLRIGHEAAGAGVGQVNLDAGTIECGNLYLYENGGSMDIEAGTLIIDDDDTADVNEAVTGGRLTAYGGSGTVNWDYNVTNPGQTTVWATEGSGPFMYWSGNFPDITVTEHITEQDDNVTGSSATTLNTSGDAEISADNTTTAQLSCGSCTLVTEYRLTFDGDGSSATGRSTVDWTNYDSFLSPAVDITHVADDNDVELTLYVRASNHAGQLADAGTYTATQTLTAHWVGP